MLLATSWKLEEDLKSKSPDVGSTPDFKIVIFRALNFNRKCRKSAREVKGSDVKKKIREILYGPFG